jgi:hypothetical protein
MPISAEPNNYFFMKKYYFLLAGAFLATTMVTQAQTRIGGSGAPDNSAMLEVTGGAGNNKGILPPRLTTAQRDAIASPATGLMIYNTTVSQLQVNTGTAAAPLWTAATQSNSWNTNGNAGTSPATNYIGTSDAQPLVLRTNNTEQARLATNGFFGLGTNAPKSRLDLGTGFGDSLADPAGKKLAVYNNAAGTSFFGLGTSLDALQFHSGSLPNDRPAMVLTNVGLGIGLGNDLPGRALQVNGAASIKGKVGIGTDTLHYSTLDLGTTYGDSLRDPVGKKLAVYNNTAGTSFFGLGTSLGALQFHSGSLPNQQPSMVLTNVGLGIGLGNNLPGRALQVNGAASIKGKVGIGTDTLHYSALDLGTTFGDSTSDPAGKKLAIYNNIAGTSFFGLGVSNNVLQFHAGSASGAVPGMVLTSSASVGIGTTAPTAALSVNGTANNLSGTWGIFSDARVKTVDGDYKDGLNTVMKIHPVKFHYNTNAPFRSAEQQIGIIAQEMEQIAPYMVTKINAEGFDDLRQYNNQALPYMLVNAVQEQQKQIEALKAENRKLKDNEAVTAQLMERVKQMEQMMGIKEMEGTSKVAGK